MNCVLQTSLTDTTYNFPNNRTEPEQDPCSARNCRTEPEQLFSVFERAEPNPNIPGSQRAEQNFKFGGPNRAEQVPRSARFSPFATLVHSDGRDVEEEGALNR